MVQVFTPNEPVFSLRNKFESKEAKSRGERTKDTQRYTYDEDRHIYTPYMVTRDTKIPNMSNLISMPKRFYLKPIPDLSEYEKDRFEGHNESVNAVKRDMEESDAPVLDLGTAALQVSDICVCVCDLMDILRRLFLSDGWGVLRH